MHQPYYNHLVRHINVVFKDQDPCPLGLIVHNDNTYLFQRKRRKAKREGKEKEEEKRGKISTNTTSTN